MNRKLANEELGRPDLETYKDQDKVPITVILDNVRSLNNIGSVFRTADAFAIEKIYLCGITAQPPHREINKTALGATESVEWKHFENTLDAVKALKSRNYQIFSVEQAEKSSYLDQVQIKQNRPIALIFGHEVNGVQQSVIDTSDEVIEIPQQGTKHSFNIAVSVGIVLWDISQKMKSS